MSDKQVCRAGLPRDLVVRPPCLTSRSPLSESGPPVGRFGTCWEDLVGRTLLGGPCWEDPVGRTLLGGPCWEDPVGRTLGTQPGHFPKRRRLVNWETGNSHGNCPELRGDSQPPRHPWDWELTNSPGNWVFKAFKACGGQALKESFENSKVPLKIQRYL